MILRIKRNIRFILPATIAGVFLVLILIFKFFTFEVQAGMVDEPGTVFYTYQQDKKIIPVKDINENMSMLVLKVNDGKIVKFKQKEEVQKHHLEANTGETTIYTDFSGDEENGDFYIGFIKEVSRDKQITIPIGKEVSDNTENIEIKIDDESINIDFVKITIIYDKVDPVIKNVEQTINDKGNVDLKVECEENYGIDEFVFFDNNYGYLFSKTINEIKKDQNGKYVIEIDQNGKYVVLAKDLSTRCSNAFGFDVNGVDNESPIITWIDKKENGRTIINPFKTVYQNVDFIIYANDANMDDMKYGIYYAGKDNGNYNSNISDSLFTYQKSNKFKVNNNGRYFFKVKDRFGHESSIAEQYVDNIDAGLDLKIFEYKPTLNDQSFTAADKLDVYFEIKGDHVNSSSETIKATLDEEELSVYEVSEEEAKSLSNKEAAQVIAKENRLRKVEIDNSEKCSYKGTITISVSEENGKYTKTKSEVIKYDALDPVLSEVNAIQNGNWKNTETVVYIFKAYDPCEDVSDEEVFKTYEEEITKMQEDFSDEKTDEETTETKDSFKIYEDAETGNSYKIPKEKWDEFVETISEKKKELASGIEAEPSVVINKNSEDASNHVEFKWELLPKEGMYRAIFSVQQGNYADITADFYVLDKAGRKSRVISKAVKIDVEKPKIKTVDVVLTDSSGNEKYRGKADNIINQKDFKGFAKNGDVVTVTIEVEDKASGFSNSQKKYLYLKKEEFDNAVELDEIISQDGKKCILSKTFTIIDSSLTWVEAGEEKSLSINDDYQFNIIINVEDAMNNTCDPNRYTSKIVYYAPLEFEKMNFSFDVSRNGVSKKKDKNEKLIANEGDKVAFSFTSHHEIITSNIYIGISSKQIYCDPKSNGGVCSGSFVVKNLNKYDNKKFKLFCEIKDRAGNVLTKDGKEIDRSTVPTNITYYAPIKDCIKNVSLSTNNASGKYTKDGDLLDVVVKSSHPISITNNEIARNKGIIISDKDKYENEYCLEYTLKNGDLLDNEEVPFVLEIDDESDNETYKCTNVYSESHEKKSRDVDYVETDKIVYFAPIEAHNLKLYSTNKNPDAHAVKNGDRVTVGFSANHEVNVESMLISNHEVLLSDDNKIEWECSIDITEDFTEDMNNLTVSAKLTDRAGNIPYEIKAEDFYDKLCYYAPVQISDASVVSSNSNDEKKYAKNGDVVKLLFTANHEINFSSAFLCDKTPEINVISEEGNIKRYELDYTLKDQDLEDQTIVKFSFEAFDAAGNNTDKIENESFEKMNQIIYYAPIVTEASLASGNRNKVYVNNGGRIMVSGKANHSVIPEFAAINGRTASISGRNSDSYSIYYIIDNNEKAMPEGAVSFSYILFDKAGNTLSVNNVTDNTTVIYDRTLPKITSEFENVSFSDHSVKYKFTFSDDYISPQDISIKVNGTEQVTDEERNSISGGVFTKEIILNTDNNYHIVANTKDLATNASKGFEKRVTVDTTKPEIKTINLSADKPEIYKSAFDVREHFEFYDKNLKEIICIVTNSNGSREWNINEPIVCDGKNTVYIMISDMADNVSQEVLYDFYIDGTAPKAIIQETLSNEFLAPEEKKVFYMEADLKISLEALHIDNISEPDKFEKLYIVDENDEIIVDLLNSPQSNSNFFTVSIKDPGNYVLCVEARDSVDNSTGLLKYPFVIKNKNIVVRIWDNKLVLLLTVTGIGILFFGAIYVLIFKRVRKPRQEWDY